MRFRAGIVLLSCCCAIGQAVAADAPRALAGIVFDDRDGDGRRDRDEPGIPDVAVSNGRALAVSDAAGRYRLAVAPGQTVFAIKPAGWRLPGDDPARAGLWRHVPTADAPAVKYGGIVAAAPPARFDIALRRMPPGDGRLDVRIFADSQVATRKEVGYYARDIVDSVLAETRDDTLGAPELGLTLGDVVDDALDLYPALNAETRRIGVPWLHIAGNHDLDFDVARDEDSLLTYRNTFGPDTFAWEEDEAVFVGLDDVIYLPSRSPGQRPGYIGGFREDQFAFLEAYLPRVPKDRLLVLGMHIPLFEMEGRETFRDADRARLFALLKDFPHVLILSGHSHTQQHWMHDARSDWHGAAPLHEYNAGAACGAFWTGAKDAAGIPDTTMADGTPNGYASLRIARGGDYALRWHVARAAGDPAIGLHAPKVLRRDAYPAYGVYANVYMGRRDDRVEFRIDGGEWMPMRRVLAPDPNLLRENLRDADAETLRGYDRSPEATTSAHLWRGTLPTDLAAGEHRIEVRAFDAWRGELRAETRYRLDDAEE
ncbi:calcineurin-like phosphoesterase family protein [Lysobacter hankyongensis]|uniref:Calcineurin-like phosphoesterase family protein n=1 Tax=Lysobacter hankyongensis TaxID=1176535 RepID=A0ABP9C8U4_9GAMM